MITPAFTGINHLGVVTADLDRAVRTWTDRYGIGPWRLYRYGSSNMSAKLDGEPVEFEMRVGLCQLTNARIELLQPLDERSHYARSLAEHGGADHIHHVRFDVASYDEAPSRPSRPTSPRAQAVMPHRSRPPTSRPTRTSASRSRS